MLQIAIQQKKRFELIQLMVVQKADVNVVDETKSTPLHSACETGNDRVVSLLLQARAAPDAVNLRGSTPLFLACEEEWRRGGARRAVHVVQVRARRREHGRVQRGHRARLPLQLRRANHAFPYHRASGDRLTRRRCFGVGGTAATAFAVRAPLSAADTTAVTAIAVTHAAASAAAACRLATMPMACTKAAAAPLRLRPLVAARADLTRSAHRAA